MGTHYWKLAESLTAHAYHHEFVTVHGFVFTVVNQVVTLNKIETKQKHTHEEEQV